MNDIGRYSIYLHIVNTYNMQRYITVSSIIYQCLCIYTHAPAAKHLWVANQFVSRFFRSRNAYFSGVLQRDALAECMYTRHIRLLLSLRSSSSVHADKWRVRTVLIRAGAVKFMYTYSCLYKQLVPGKPPAQTVHCTRALLPWDGKDRTLRISKYHKWHIKNSIILIPRADY